MPGILRVSRNAARAVGARRRVDVLRVTEHLSGRRALDHALFGVAPIALTVWVLIVVWTHDGHGVDFSRQYWVAGWHVLHGMSPYAALHGRLDAALAFPYPASTAMFFAPFALVSRAFSRDLFTAICIASPLASLWILKVRDWRLYGLALLLAPVVSGWQTANLTLLAGVGLATLWRFRDRRFIAGLTAALLISLKPFLWPLALWLLVTRRSRAALHAAGCVVAIQMVSWWVLGFDQIHRFLHVTFSVTHAFRGWGYSVASSARHLGVGPVAVTALALAVPAVVATALAHEFRHKADKRSFVLAVSLVLCASPILWSHYFALLIIPLAIVRPKLSLPWACLVPLWTCPVTNPAGWQSVVALASFAGTVCVLLALSEARDVKRISASSPISSSPVVDSSGTTVSVAAEA